MPTLYTMPGTCSLAPNIAIQWLGAPVEIKTLAYGDQRKEPYTAINPKGKVPAVTFEDGDVLTEAAAILSWLGAAYGSESFARDTALGRKEAEALSYMTSEVHADFGPHFTPKRFAASPAAQDEVKNAAYEKIAGHYRFMDEVLSQNGDWYLGRRSFADAYLYVLTRWADRTPKALSEAPTLAAHRKRMEADEGVKTALRLQNMEPVDGS